MQQATQHTESPGFSRIKSRLKRLKNEDLLVMLVVHRTKGLQQIITLIDDPELDWIAVYKQAMSILNRLVDPRTWAELCRTPNRNLNVLAPLVRLNLNCAYTYREIVNRIQRRPNYSVSKFAWTLWLEGKPEEDIFLILLTSVRIGRARKRLRDLRTYRPKKEDSSDIMSVAKIGAWEYWHAVQSAISEELEPISVPTHLPKDRTKLWKVLSPSLLQMEGAAWARAFLPVLRGSLDKWPDKVNQALRNHYEKWTAQKRQHNGEYSYTEVGTGREPTESGYYGVPFKTKETEMIAEGWRGKQRLESRIASIVLEAEKRWGPKAARAFAVRSDVNTDKEAAKLAGIGERTYRNYVSALKEIFAGGKGEPYK